MEGIIEQINKLKEDIAYRPLTYESLKEVIEALHKAKVEHRKTIKNNLKFLRKRAKELKKDIPLDLYYVVSTGQDIGMSFYIKHKEWMINLKYL